MTQTALPYLFMRGGSSRGPYFNRADLPVELDDLADVLVRVIGSGHILNIDGIGGGHAVTTKVAMLSPSDDDWADVDYFFAQVGVDTQTVDFKPTCGNILSGVGPAALEMGLIAATDPTTQIKIRAVNTGARIQAVVQTPGGRLTYTGETEIAGIPGTAAPVHLTFMDVIGSKTGAFLPTGRVCDVMDGIDVTCMDVAMPVIIMRAVDLGLTGYESVSDLNDMPDLLARMDSIRIQAGLKMGLGDVAQSVIPKVTLIAPPVSGGTMTVRYFMPWTAHPSLAVTGAQCLASCALTPGSVADGIAHLLTDSPAPVKLEHPSGMMDVLIEFDRTDGFTLKAAGLVRTARKLADGHVYIPD